MESLNYEWRVIEALTNVYRDSAPKKTAVYKWIQRFKENRADCQDDSRSGRPSTSRSEENVAAVQSLLEEDRRITIDYISSTIGISRGSVNSILTENLGLSKLSSRWVPKALRQEQMDQRADASVMLLNRMEQWRS